MSKMFKVGDWVKSRYTGWTSGLVGEVICPRHSLSNVVLVRFPGAVAGHNGASMPIMEAGNKECYWIGPSYLSLTPRPKPILDPLAQELIADYLSS